jgi:hypothetical protein
MKGYDDMLNIIGYIVEGASIHVCGYSGDKILFQSESCGKVVRRKLKEVNGRFSFTHDKKKFYIKDNYVKMHTLV